MSDELQADFNLLLKIPVSGRLIVCPLLPLPFESPNESHRFLSCQAVYNRIPSLQQWLCLRGALSGYFLDLKKVDALYGGSIVSPTFYVQVNYKNRYIKSQVFFEKLAGERKKASFGKGGGAAPKGR